MGKYMKKSKITGDVAVMELSQPTTLGVRTRAKTLALQRLLSPPTSDAASNPDSSSSSSYLQLRSRRLEKPPLTKNSPSKLRREEAEEGLKANRNNNLSSRGSSRLRLSSEESGGCEDWGVEVSFGENCLEFEARERSTRESTPCSLIKDSDIIATPGSTTRRTSSTATNQQVWSNFHRNIPTSYEMEEFFAHAEQQQQRLFIEKYNFDVVNDLPLHGRYEWVPINQ